MNTLQKENETLRDELARTQEKLSEARAELAKLKLGKVDCDNCGEEFVRKFGSEKNCSKSCAAKSREKAKRTEKKKLRSHNSFLSGTFA